MSKKKRYETGLRRQHLIDARMDKGWSRSELAKMIGTSSSVIQYWELGYSKPIERYRVKIADVFNLCNRLDDDYDIDEYIDAFLELVPAKRIEEKDAKS